MHRICFVSKSNPIIASHRYHNLIPAREITKLPGHFAQVMPYPGITEEFDTFVFSKHFNYGDYWYAKALKAAGKKTALHICDNHFDTEHRQHYMRMCDEVDVILTPTTTLSTIIERETRRKAHVVDDPFEFELAEPQFNPSAPLKVLWFGHQSNLNDLIRILPLNGCEMRMCTMLPEGAELPIVLNQIPYLPYTYANMMKALEWCDCVIIPSSLKDAKNLCKSPNRLFESVRRGKFVIASPLPAYMDFDDWMYIGDIHDGLAWLKTQESIDIKLRIAKAQEFINEVHSPERTALLWLKALE